MTNYFAICEEKGYVKPTVYQGHYNALYRGCEKELLPLLREHGCVFNAYSPLAGGFLTGKVTFDAGPGSLERTRWRGESTMAAYPGLYDNDAMHGAMRRLKAACDTAAGGPMSTQEAALRWLVHHSALGDGDGIVVGAKTVEQLRGNLEGMRKGPLEGEVLQVIEGLCGSVSGGK